MKKSRRSDIADVSGDPLERSLVLAKHVTDAAQREMWAKARKHVPALSLGAVAGTLGVLATAASYRLSLLLLEKRMSPEAAALVAAAAYGGGAGCAAVAAVRRSRGLPPPLPTDTARQVAEIVADASGS